MSFPAVSTETLTRRLGAPAGGRKGSAQSITQGEPVRDQIGNVAVVQKKQARQNSSTLLRTKAVT